MSITDELRKWAEGDALRAGMSLRTARDQALAIADRIDAEHESACAEAYGNGVMSVPIALDESAWVELPKDADGVPINVGDMMAYADNTKAREVVALVPPAVFLTEDGPRYADMCRHYHAPTVEDMLWQLIVDIRPDMEDKEAVPIVKACAEKLRLAEVGEE